MPSPIARVRTSRLRIGIGVGSCVALASATWMIRPRTGLGHIIDQMRALPTPSWPLILAAAVATAAGYGLSAVALQTAAGRRLPFGRTVLAQLAAAAANRITLGGVGGAAVNGRYLTTQRFSAGEAGAAITLTAIAHVIVATAGVLLFAPALTHLPWVSSLFAARLWRVPLVVVAVPAVAMATWLAVRALRRHRRSRPMPFIADGLAALAIAARRPKRLAALLVTTAAVKASNLVALLCAMWAFDGDIPDWKVATVLLVGVPAAEAVPTPGGLGTVDAVLVAGLAGVGGATTAIVAAVVVFRLLTFWAPIVPGAVASGVLRRRYAL